MSSGIQSINHLSTSVIQSFLACGIVGKTFGKFFIDATGDFGIFVALQLLLLLAFLIKFSGRNASEEAEPLRETFRDQRKQFCFLPIGMTIIPESTTQIPVR